MTESAIIGCKRSKNVKIFRVIMENRKIKGINKWETVEEIFKTAYIHYVKRQGPASENDFLLHLIKHGSILEKRKAKK